MCHARHCSHAIRTAFLRLVGKEIDGCGTECVAFRGNKSRNGFRWRSGAILLVGRGDDTRKVVSSRELVLTGCQHDDATERYIDQFL